MMDMLDDGTLFLKQVETMIGDETEWAGKKRLYREKQKLIGTYEGQKGTMSDKSIELEKELEKDIIEPEKTTTPKPEKHKYGSFNNVLLTDDENERLTQDFHYLADKAIQYLSEYKVEKGYTSKSDNLTIRRWVIDAVRKREGLPPIPKPAKATAPRKCPKCGGEMRGAGCTVCFSNFDEKGNEI
jgi:hypothetical protein